MTTVLSEQWFISELQICQGSDCTQFDLWRFILAHFVRNTDTEGKNIVLTLLLKEVKRVAANYA